MSFRCDYHRSFVGVYLGGETPAHQQAIQEAREGFFEDVDADMRIRCEKDDHFFPAHRHIMCTQSKVLDRKCGPRAYKPDGTPFVPEICLRHPVTPRILRAIMDFAYTRDYAVYEKDVTVSKSFLYGNIRCNNCKQHCRLLSFHLGVVRAAISIGMDGLRQFAIEKYRRVLDGAPLQILQFAVTDVYSSKVFVEGGKYSATWNSGDVHDCRPDLVVPACAKYVESCRWAARHAHQIEVQQYASGEADLLHFCREFVDFQAALARALLSLVG